MPRPGDAVNFRPESPTQLTFLRGIFVAVEDDCWVLAVPASAVPAGARYNIPGQSGDTVAVTYIIVAVNAVLEASACPPEETTSFASPPALNELLRVYFVQQSGSDSGLTAVASRRVAEPLPSSRTRESPTSVANAELQQLTKLVEKLALSVDDQARALAEAFSQQRAPPPSAPAASRIT